MRTGPLRIVAEHDMMESARDAPPSAPPLRSYRCAGCTAVLADHDDLVSKVSSPLTHTRIHTAARFLCASRGLFRMRVFAAQRRLCALRATS